MIGTKSERGNKMKHTNKKGFTIVELVIVIAVIAILAAVLIPNLSRLVEKANESKAMQQAKAAYEAYLVDHAEEMDSLNLCIESNGLYYHVVAGQFSATQVEESDSCSYTKMKVNSDGKLVSATTTTASTSAEQPTP